MDIDFNTEKYVTDLSYPGIHQEQRLKVFCEGSFVT